MSITKYSFTPEEDNPNVENVVFHRMSEVKCLHFLNRLSVIAQFG